MKDLILYLLIVLLLVVILTLVLWYITNYSKSSIEILSLRVNVVSVVITTLLTISAIIFAYQQLQINKSLKAFEQYRHDADKAYYQARLRVTLDDLEYLINNPNRTIPILQSDNINEMKKLMSELRRPLESELKNPELLANDTLRQLWLDAIATCRLVEWPEGLPETEEINSFWFKEKLNQYHSFLNEIHWTIYPEQLEAIKKMSDDRKNKEKEGSEQAND